MKNYEVYKFVDADGDEKFIFRRPDSARWTKEKIQKRIALFEEMGYELEMYLKCDADTFFSHKAHATMVKIIRASEMLDKATTEYHMGLMSLRHFYDYKERKVKRIGMLTENFKDIMREMIDRGLEFRDEEIVVFYNRFV
ncbi:MAG: hypothetical protein J6F30_04635 [Cellulosilyticum sp.]|nr:hypothetical protein [Cellulosilyticum sp.]